MEIFEHNLPELFEQLGLDSDEKSISTFIERHSLSRFDPLSEAHFWSNSQKQFLREAKAEDADWAEMVDLLDTLLRKN